MDYEKAYKEALERAKKLYEQGTITESLSYVFTELAETEDERIRKAQLDYWRSVGGKEWHGVPVQETIAWLEKQATKTKWTEADEAHLHSVTTHLEQWIECHPNTCGADIQGENLAWLESLKQRLI